MERLLSLTNKPTIQLLIANLCRSLRANDCGVACNYSRYYNNHLPACIQEPQQQLLVPILVGRSQLLQVCNILYVYPNVHLHR